MHKLQISCIIVKIVRSVYYQNNPVTLVIRIDDHKNSIGVIYNAFFHAVCTIIADYSIKVHWLLRVNVC